MRKPRILVVDNEDDSRRSLRLLLESQGYAVLEAATVEQGVALSEVPTIDLALVDLRMIDHQRDTDVSGLDVAEACRQHGIPAIIATAYDSTETARLAIIGSGREPPAVDYVPKRLGPQTLVERVERLRGMTLLHISDLHMESLDHGEEPYNQRRAREQFVPDAMGLPGVAFHSIQGIIVSGDVSFRCQPRSFDLAEKFLLELAQQFGLENQQIILAPGNHDVNRAKAQSTKDTLVAMQAGDQSWFAKFDEYLAFTKRICGEEAFTLTELFHVSKLGNRVAVVAFNSCLVEGDETSKCLPCEKRDPDNVHYHGWINREQVDRAREQLAGFQGLRIAVFHHYIAPKGARGRTSGCAGKHLCNYHPDEHGLKHVFYEAGFRLLLHGHRHVAEFQGPHPLEAKEALHFGCGKFWMGKGRPGRIATYLALQLVPQPGHSRVFMRSYYPAGLHAGIWDKDPNTLPDGFIRLPDEVFVLPPA